MTFVCLHSGHPKRPKEAGVDYMDGPDKYKPVIYCRWSDWSQWSFTGPPKCTKKRNRFCTCEGKGKGKCAGPAKEKDVDEDCGVTCQWSPWSSWSAPSMTCGPAKISRVSKCKCSDGSTAAECGSSSHTKTEKKNTSNKPCKYGSKEKELKFYETQRFRRRRRF